MFAKWVTIGIVLLFVGAGVPALATFNGKLSAPVSNILYVGGSGPGNYTTIQAAIDSAAPGDMVFVYDDSSPYHENLEIAKSITLQGESRQTTVINGSILDGWYVINITADDVSIRGFTIQCYGHMGGFHLCKLDTFPNINGIPVLRGAAICDNIIQSTPAEAVFALCVNDSNFSGNIIDQCEAGIVLWRASGNIVDQNVIRDCAGNCSEWAIGLDSLYESRTNHFTLPPRFAMFFRPFESKNSITGNLLIGNRVGISLNGCLDTVVSDNTISNSTDIGFMVTRTTRTMTTRNNFIGNRVNAQFVADYIYQVQNNWTGNYWGKTSPRPVPVRGTFLLEVFKTKLIPVDFIYRLVPVFAFDKQPAQGPFPI
jgi:parallel beta-helix repeat protein